jgi:hypothetical protein
MDALKHIFLKNGSKIFQSSTGIFDTLEISRENRALVPPSRPRTHGTLFATSARFSVESVELRIECTVTVAKGRVSGAGRDRPRGHRSTAIEELSNSRRVQIIGRSLNMVSLVSDAALPRFRCRRLRLTRRSGQVWLNSMRRVARYRRTQPMHAWAVRIVAAGLFHAGVLIASWLASPVVLLTRIVGCW